MLGVVDPPPARKAATGGKDRPAHQVPTPRCRCRCRARREAGRSAGPPRATRRTRPGAAREPCSRMSAISSSTFEVSSPCPQRRRGSPGAERRATRGRWAPRCRNRREVGSRQGRDSPDTAGPASPSEGTQRREHLPPGRRRTGGAPGRRGPVRWPPTSRSSSGTRRPIPRPSRA